MRIDCLKYRWDTSTDKSDVNFFSDVDATLVQIVDLFPFLIKDSMSNIEYGFEDIDDNNSLYFTASNFSFQCISDNQDANNLVNAFNLIDFFEVFQVNEYIKWRINVYNDSNTLIYSGVLSKDGIEIDGVSKKILDITVVGEEKGLDYEAMIGLHDRLLAQDPPHSSPLEHCAKTMNNAEYESFYKGQIGLGGESGWCYNLKGFISYRYMIDNNLIK